MMHGQTQIKFKPPVSEIFSFQFETTIKNVKNRYFSGFTYFEHKNQTHKFFLILMYVLIMCSNYNIIQNTISSKLTPYLETIVEESLLPFLIEY